MAIPMPRRVLVLALDGATFDVIRPLAAEGRLPHLARWMVEGEARPLRSTVPPMTFPAWSSFLTGLGPGRHGIFDFTRKVEGRWRIRFVHAGERAGASVLARASAAGRRVLCLGMPATWPPEPVRGLLVSGFDAPVSAGTDERSASDPALYRRIAARVGPWMRPGLRESAEEAAFHERALPVLLERVDRKRDFALEALRVLEAEGGRPDLAVVVFSETDTVAHHYWRDHDAASPRHDPAATPERRGAIAAVYERVDAACGEIRRAFGEDAVCAVVSDHGAGGADARVVHLNRFLEEHGFLARRRRTSTADRSARRLRDAALRLLPPAAAQALFRRLRAGAARIESAARFGGFDWRRTAAVSEEANTLPGIWINLRGREATGIVAPADYERLRDELIDALGSWRTPEGEPVVARARRREEVYEGPFVGRAPDLVLDLGTPGGYSLSLVPTPWEAGGPALRTLSGPELAGGRGRGMNGTHRPEGIWIAAGLPPSGLPPDAAASIVDAAPTLLDALGVPPDAGASSGDGLSLLRRELSAREEALIADRLRALGYLE